MSDVNQPYQTLGCILPDLVRASGPFRLRESKITIEFPHTEIELGISIHLRTDQLFHQSEFFTKWMKQINKDLVDQQLESIPKYLNFYSHILVEMYLDRMLLERSKGLGEQFYSSLTMVDKAEFANWWNSRISIEEMDNFWKFYQRFIDSKFVLQYSTESGFKRAVSNFAFRVHQYKISEIDAEKISNSCKELELTIHQDWHAFWQFMIDGIKK